MVVFVCLLPKCDSSTNKVGSIDRQNSRTLEWSMVMLDKKHLCLAVVQNWSRFKACFDFRAPCCWHGPQIDYEARARAARAMQEAAALKRAFEVAEFVGHHGSRPLADLLRSQSLDEFTWRDTDTWILKYIIEIYWMSFNSQYEELAWFVHLSMQKPIYQKYIKIYSIQKKHDSLSQSEPSHLFHIVGLWVSCDCPRLNSR